MAVQIGIVGKTYSLARSIRPVMRAANGDIYVVLLNTTDGKLEMWKSVDNGVNWTNPGTNQTGLANGAYDSHIDGTDPQIIHTVYYYSTTAVYYNTFNTSTGAWSGGVSLATVVSSGYRACSIVCDSNNVPHVIYIDYPTSTTTLKYRNKTGGSWRAAVTIENVNYVFFPVITIDPVDAAGHRYDLPQVAYYKSSFLLYAALGNANNATSFTTVNPASTNCSSASYPVMSVDVNGKTNILSVYSYQQCTSIPGASDWGTPGDWTKEANVFGDSYNSNSGSLVINGTNRYIFSEQTALHDIRKIRSWDYAAWGGIDYLEAGTYQDPRARWQYSNNPSYETYGIDFVFASANPGIVYWGNYPLASTYEEALVLSAGIETLEDSENRTDNPLSLAAATALSCEAVVLRLMAIGVVLDEVFTMQDGKDYNLRFRRRDDSLCLTLRTTVGESDELYFYTPIPLDGDLPSIQDLAMFGEKDIETVRCVVKSIERGSDLTAKIYCVDEAPDIHTANTGLIPAFDSQITIPAEWYVPEIYTVQSDSTVGARNSDGSWSPRIAITLVRPFGELIAGSTTVRSGFTTGRQQADIVSIEALFRPSGTVGPWSSITTLSADSQIILAPVFEGVTYEYKLRYVKSDGTKGNFSELDYHTVVGGPESLPDITNLVAVYRDSRVALVWDVVQDIDNPVISYEIRKGDDWGSSEVMGQIKDPLYTLPGDGKYWVAAVAGLLYSANPTFLLIAGAILNQNIVAEYDEQATAWTGTLTDCYVDGSDFLQLDVVDDEVVEEGTYEIPVGHIVDIGEPMPCMVSVAYTMLGSSIRDSIDDVLDWDAISNVDGNYAGFCGVKVQMQLAGADEVFGAWQDFAPGTYVARKFNFQLLLTSLDVEVTPIVQSFTFQVDMPDRMESDNDLGIADTGASITFAKPFQVAPNVQITIIDAQDGDYYELSNITTTGFDLIVKNGGVGVHRHINWLAKGY